MPLIGYHASHEQIDPRRLLKYLRLAEEAGFGGGMCSDHLFPWTSRQGESGYAWSWLASALEATSLTMGVVTVPGGWRYHPAVMAQAAATLAQMYPRRFWLAAGSGEFLNEHVVGADWPDKDVRKARLLEGVEIMRALWRGEEVTSDGIIPVEAARVFSLPEEPPRILGAALSRETAAWAATWADGLITTATDIGSMREIVNAFRDAGGADKPVFLQAQLSYAESDSAAVEAAWDQWRSLYLDAEQLTDLRLPEEFERESGGMSRSEVAERIRCSGSLDRHLDWIMEYTELGFAGIYLHNVNRDEQERFIEDFGADVLPLVGGMN